MPTYKKNKDTKASTKSTTKSSIKSTKSTNKNSKKSKTSKNKPSKGTTSKGKMMSKSNNIKKKNMYTSLKPSNKKKVAGLNVSKPEMKQADLLLPILVKKLNHIRNAKKMFQKLTPRQKISLKMYKGASYTTINEYLRTGKLKEIAIPFHRAFQYNTIRDAPNSLLDKMFKDVILKNISGNDVPISKIPDYINSGVNFLLGAIDEIDSVFQRNDIPTLTKKDILYHGISIPVNDFTKYKLNTKIQMDKYISSSFNKEVSERFSNSCCMFKLINLDKVPYIYLSWDVTNPDYYHPKHQLDDTSYLNEFGDEYELLLPRNLEFEVVSVEKYYPPRANMKHNIKEINKELQKENKESNKPVTQAQLKKVVDKVLDYRILITLKFVKQSPLKPVIPYFYTSDTKIIVNSPNDYE